LLELKEEKNISNPVEEIPIALILLITSLNES
jgi:hypothetical protein